MYVSWLVHKKASRNTSTLKCTWSHTPFLSWSFKKSQHSIYQDTSSTLLGIPTTATSAAQTTRLPTMAIWCCGRRDREYFVFSFCFSRCFLFSVNALIICLPHSQLHARTTGVLALHEWGNKRRIVPSKFKLNEVNPDFEFIVGMAGKGWDKEEEPRKQLPRALQALFPEVMILMALFLSLLPTTRSDPGVSHTWWIAWFFFNHRRDTQTECLQGEERWFCDPLRLLCGCS